MTTKSNSPDLITYEDCVRQNNWLLREERRAAKELKSKPKEINIRQIISDRAYAKRFGVQLKPLPPEIERLIKEHFDCVYGERW